MISDMKVFHRTHEYGEWYRSQTAALHRQRGALVTTKGSVPEGHLPVVERGRRECDLVSVAAAVHPGQFAEPCEYDRLRSHTSTQDLLERLRASGCVDVLLVLLGKRSEYCKYGWEHGAFLYLESEILP